MSSSQSGLPAAVSVPEGRYETIFCGSVPNMLVARELLKRLNGGETDVQSAGRAWRLIYLEVDAKNASDAITVGDQKLRELLGDELKSELVAVSVNWKRGTEEGLPSTFYPDGTDD